MAVAKKSMPKAAAVAAAPMIEAPVAAPTLAADAEKVVGDAAAAPAEALDAAVEQFDSMREAFRKGAETGLEQSRAAYERVKKAAEEATGSMEQAYETATKGVAEINNKAIDLMKQNADATFELAKALSSARSLSDIIVLQSEHARKQYESLTVQAKDMGELLQKVAVDAAAPLKGVIERSAGAAV